MATIDTASVLAKLKEAQEIDNRTKDDILRMKTLRDDAAVEIMGVVYSIGDLDEMVKLCNDFGITNTRYFKGAMANSESRCPDHDKTEWTDVQSSVSDKIENILRKRVSEG